MAPTHTIEVCSVEALRPGVEGARTTRDDSRNAVLWGVWWGTSEKLTLPRSCSQAAGCPRRYPDHRASFRKLLGPSTPHLLRRDEANISDNFPGARLCSCIFMDSTKPPHLLCSPRRLRGGRARSDKVRFSCSGPHSEWLGPSQLQGLCSSW